jgi:hypothetical protein
VAYHIVAKAWPQAAMAPGKRPWNQAAYRVRGGQATMTDQIRYFKSEAIGDFIRKNFTRYPSGVIPVAEKYFALSSWAFCDLEDIFREGANLLVEGGDEFDPDLSIDYTPTQEVLFEVRVFYLPVVGGKLQKNGADEASIDEKQRFLLQLVTEEYLGEGSIMPTPAFDSTYKMGFARLNRRINREVGNPLEWYYQALLTAQNGKLWDEHDLLSIGDFSAKLAFCIAMTGQVQRFSESFELSPEDK